MHAQTPGPFALLESKLGKPSIITAHIIPETLVNSLILDIFLSRQIRSYMRIVFDSYKYVVAPSEYAKKKIIALGIPEKKITVIPNFVNMTKYKRDNTRAAKFRKRFCISKDEFVVLCVGQIMPRKGIEEFIETARKMPNIRFVWVGTRPFGLLTAGYTKLTTVIAKAPKNVTFTGFVDDIIGAYSASDIFFLPSKQETFGLVILEAAACKLPIILQNNKCYESLFKRYTLITSDFVKVINSVKQNKKLYKKYASLSIKMANKYNSKKIVKQYVDFYKKILKIKNL